MINEKVTARFNAELQKQKDGKPCDEVFILAYKVKAAQLENDETEAIAKEAKAKFDELKKELITFMELKKVENVRYEDLGLFSPTSSAQPKIVDMKAFKEWLIATGQESVLTVNSQTLKTMNTEYEGAHGCPMPGCESYYKSNLSIRK